jgi:transposase
MSRKVLYCGLDVDDQSFHAYLISPCGEFFSFKCSPTFKHLSEKLQKFSSDWELKVCYEAGYFGFSLCRSLRAANFNCVVISPAHIPQIVGDRVKTDKKDAQNLAVFLMQGLLKEVNVPDEEDESVRNLLRSRANAVKQLASLKNYIQASCRQNNLDYRKETGKSHYWTQIYRQWLDSKIANLKNPIVQFDLKNQLSLLHSMESAIERYDDEIDKISDLDKYKSKVKSLRCLKGINTISAMTIVAEIGDVKRFSHPKKLVSYCGLDIAEYSSGGKEKKLGITRTGSRFLRTTLIEANQNNKSGTYIGKDLAKRRQEASIESIQIADKCLSRINKKRYDLLSRNKHPNKVKVACAREMVGFVWELLSKN